MSRTSPVSRATRRAQRGAAMVELALCLLLTVSLIYAIMEFGRIVYSYTVLTGATREASRYAIVHGGNSGSPATQEAISERVKSWAVGLDTSAITVNTTWVPSNAPGATVRVVAQYQVTPFSGLIMAGPLTLGSRSEMVISQ
jgi:Flp pilus assembly protein TadG